MCGDWNTTNYIFLKKAGYSLANDGSMKTIPYSSTVLDNIAVRGLKIENVNMIETKLSDHNSLVCELIIK